ncbi:MAG: tetratricopeptide repeat protein [Pleurocapsa sp. MO_192.B19]|nr:tetratricopeptide repeat protein [Pleurocapsa sp. MO_192.B19]
MNPKNANSSMLSWQNSNSINPDNSDMRSLRLIQSADHLDRPTQQQKKTISHIYSQQALIYFQQKNWHKAILACKNALETFPDNADAYKTLGNVLQRQGKKAAALGVYAKALVIDPNSAPIYANLGSFYAEQKDWQQALDYFQQAVILDPSLAGAYRSLAQIWEELGDTDKAIECFCQAVNLEPQTLIPEEYFSFGKILYQQGKVREASIFYIQGVKLNPRAEKELAQLVKILEELEEWQQSVVYYHQLIALNQTDDNYQQNQTTAAKPIKSLLSRSKARAKKAISHRPSPENTTSLTKNNTSRLLSQPKSDNHQTSTKSLPQTLQILPTTITFPEQTKDNNSPSVVDSATDELPSSKNSSHEDKKPDSAVSWNDLGSLYAQKQQWEKAISCYQEALQVDPKFGRIHRNLARVYNKLEQREKAVQYWYEAFTLEPDRVKPEEYFSLAKSLLEHNQVEEAIACLRRTIQLQPNFDQAYLILGKILEKQGKQEEAQNCYLQTSRNKL